MNPNVEKLEKCQPALAASTEALEGFESLA